MRRVRVRVYFEPRDVWLGLYWNGPYVQRTENGKRVIPPEDRVDLYFCLLPCLPIKVTLWKPADKGEAG